MGLNLPPGAVVVGNGWMTAAVEVRFWETWVPSTSTVGDTEVDWSVKLQPLRISNEMMNEGNQFAHSHFLLE